MFKNLVAASVIAAFLVVSRGQAADKQGTKYPFAVKVTGKGKPMILIPGLACSGAVWDETVDHFKDRYECHVLTLAGFAGQPSLKVEGRFLDRIRGGMAAYIKDKKLDKPVIVGHSLGGYLTYDLGAAEPGLVGPLVVVDAFPCFMAVFNPKADAKAIKAQGEKTTKDLAEKPREIFLKDERKLFESWLSDKEQREKVTQWVTDSDQKTIARAMGELLGSDLRDDLSKIKAPLLVLAAFDKNYEGFGVTLQSLSKVYDGQLEKVKTHKIAVTAESKHFIMYDQPKWMFEKMEEFLKEHAK